MSKKPPRPSDAKLLRDSAEVAKITNAAPNGLDVARSLGPFNTCKTPTLIENEDGQFQVNITDERATPEENRRRMGLVNDAMAEKRALETDRSVRRYEENDHITVHDVRTGETREIPADMEDQIARKKWARPGSRKRTYFFMGH